MAQSASQAVTGSDGDPRAYWWQVCRGAEVLRVFSATPESEAWSAVHRHPVLLLPELVDAAELVLGQSRATMGLRQMQQGLRGTPLFAPYHRMLATALASAPDGSRRVNLERALAVMAEVRGAAIAADRAVDDALDQAIHGALGAAMSGGRSAASVVVVGTQIMVIPAGPAVATAMPAPALAAVATLAAAAPRDPVTPAPAAAPAPLDPAWGRLFLDEAELQGFVRGADRRLVDPSAYDRAFATHRGVKAGSAEWLGNEAAPMYRVVEARWLFPSTKAARGYLESPQTQATASDGLKGVTAPALGDAALAWGGSEPGRTPPARLARQIVLFRIGRLVVRLHATEGPRAPHLYQALAQDMLLPIADAAIRRARWALSQYWLTIAGATEAAGQFVAATPRSASALFAVYPILLLPELPTAIASLGDAYRAAAPRLASLQATLKSNWDSYRGVMRALVRALLDDAAGEPSTNADAALELVIAHRRLDPDFSWAAIEAECRARA
jgi:hypothetical protein